MFDTNIDRWPVFTHSVFNCSSFLTKILLFYSSAMGEGHSKSHASKPPPRKLQKQTVVLLLELHLVVHDKCFYEEFSEHVSCVCQFSANFGGK